jgi:hypothetical protein
MDKEGRPSVGKDESLEPHLQFLLGRFTLLIRRLQTAEQRASSSEEEGRALAQKLAAAERRGGRALDESSSTKRARALAHQLKEKDAQLKLQQKNYDDRIRAISARSGAALERQVRRSAWRPSAAALNCAARRAAFGQPLRSRTFPPAPRLTDERHCIRIVLRRPVHTSSVRQRPSAKRRSKRHGAGRQGRQR